MEELCERGSLDRNFKDQFTLVFEGLRKRELAKFNFYRKISSEMVINIDAIGRARQQTKPTIDAFLNKIAQIDNRTEVLGKENEQLSEKNAEWSHREGVLSELIKFRFEEEELCLGRLLQTTSPYFAKLVKAEKRIEGADAVEFTRLKNNLRNNESNAIVHPLHCLLAMLGERPDGSKDKNPLGAVLNSQVALAGYLQHIRKG